ncbi:MAG: hypothetical protein HC893_10880, partial [Chloroflexaceae bacterium]|nr:hypothetical protein [Chloroflexaceae bacterium]
RAGTLARRYGVPLVCTPGTRAALNDKHSRGITIEELPAGQQARLGTIEVQSLLCRTMPPNQLATPSPQQAQPSDWRLTWEAGTMD